MTLKRIKLFLSEYFRTTDESLINTIGYLTFQSVPLRLPTVFDLEFDIINHNLLNIIVI